MRISPPATCAALDSAMGSTRRRLAADSAAMVQRKLASYSFCQVAQLAVHAREEVYWHRAANLGQIVGVWGSAKSGTLRNAALQEERL